MNKQKNPKRTNLPTRKQSVFLCGTDRVQDLLNQTYRYLDKVGFKPFWFRKSTFPQLSSNAMDNCLEVVKLTDKFVLILDDRLGLPYKKTDKSISEIEFDTAWEAGQDILVFIRKNIWAYSKVYHRQTKKKGQKLTSEEFEAICLDGEMGVYDFIENIQHKKRKASPAVPWIVPFDLFDEIEENITNKWILPLPQQKTVAKSIAAVIDKEPSMRPKKVVFDKNVLDMLQRLPVSTRIIVRYKLQLLATGSVPNSPDMQIVTSTKPNTAILRFADLRVVLAFSESAIHVTDAYLKSKGRK